MSKTPMIRLQSFEQDWETIKLKDISIKNTMKNTDKVYTNSLTNSAAQGIVSQEDFFDKNITNAKNSQNYYIVKPDDFVYNPRISIFAPVGPINRNNLNLTGIMSPLYYVFSVHSINLDFLEVYFKTSFWHPFMYRNGDTGARSDRFSIREKVFLEMPIPYPTEQEQIQIGRFFKELDNLIELQQLTIDNLKELKKGFLQKMFPKKDKRIPSVRISGQTGEWSTGLFNDYLKNYPSKQYIAEPNKELSSGSIVIQQGDNPIIGKSENDPFENFEDVILFGDHTLSLYRPEEKFLVATDGIKILSLQNFNRDFSYVLLEKYKPKSEGYKRHFSILRDTKICFAPKFEEQRTIGDFFKKIDKLIELELQELEALQEMKKGFLQKMFV